MDSTNMTALSASSDYSQIVAENIDTLLEINRNSDKYIACFNELYWIIICAKGIQSYIDLQTEQGFTDAEFWERLNTIFNNISELGLIASNITSINDLVAKLNENPSLLEETINSLDLAYASFYTSISEAKDEMLNIIQTATNTAKTEILALINLIAGSTESLKIELMQSVTELENTLTTKINELQTQHTTDIASLTDKITELQNQHTIDVSSLTEKIVEQQTQHTTDISSLTEKIVEQQTQHTTDVGALTTKITDLQTQHTTDVGTINEKIVEQQTQYNTDITTINNKLTEQDTQLNEYGVQYNQDISSINQQISDQYTKLNDLIANPPFPPPFVPGDNITIIPQTDEFGVIRSFKISSTTSVAITGDTGSLNIEGGNNITIEDRIDTEEIIEEDGTTTTTTTIVKVISAIKDSIQAGNNITLDPVTNTDGSITYTINADVSNIDLSNYFTKEEINTLLSDYVTQTQLTEIINSLTDNDTTYTAGDNVTISTDNVISVDLSNVSTTEYEAGTNITFIENPDTGKTTISAEIPVVSSDGATIVAGNNITITDSVLDDGTTTKTISAIDTVYTAGDNVTISDSNEISVDLSSIDSSSYEAGTNVTFTENATTGKTIISATDTNTEYVAGSNITITEEVPELPIVTSTGYLMTGSNFNDNEKTIASEYVSKTFIYNETEYIYPKVLTNKNSNLSITNSGTSFNLIAIAINTSQKKAYAVRLKEQTGTWTPEINTWIPLSTIDITDPVTSSGAEVVWNKSVTIDVKVWNPSNELVATLGTDVIPLIDNSTDEILGWYPVSDKAKAELETIETTSQKIISATVPTSSGGAIIEAGTNVSIEESVNDSGETVKTISATDTTYTAGTNVTISDSNEISVDLSNITIPNVTEYEAGDNITFTENADTGKTTISAELSYKYQSTFTLHASTWVSSSKTNLASLSVPSSSNVTTDSYITLSGNISAYSTISQNNVTLSDVGITNNVLILTFNCTSIPQSDIPFMITIK